MALYTFTNAVSDNDLDNPSNWDISGSPAGATPGVGDTADLSSQTINTGTCIAPVTAANGATINGGTFTAGFSVSGVTINGGSYSGTVAFSGSTLNFDPGTVYSIDTSTFNSGTFASAFTDNGGCTYESGTTFNVSFILGSGSTINGGTFNNAISTVTSGSFPTINGGTFVSGSQFTSSFINNGTFTTCNFTTCSINSGTFTTCTVVGSTAIQGGSWDTLTVNSDVTFSGTPTFSIGLTIHYIRGPYTFNAYIQNCSISVPDPGYPVQGNVLTGTSVGNIGDGKGALYTGTLTIPTAGQVQSGVTYGVGGFGSTGTLAVGTRGYAG